MMSNRKESFRFKFKEKIPALFTIKQIDSEDVTTSEGDAFISDISPSGIKLVTKLYIPKTSEKEVHLSISFTLNKKRFNYFGEILWQKKKYPFNELGMKLFTDDIQQREIIDQLKFYAKNNS